MARQRRGAMLPFEHLSRGRHDPRPPRRRARQLSSRSSTPSPAAPPCISATCADPATGEKRAPNLEQARARDRRAGDARAEDQGQPDAPRNASSSSRCSTNCACGSSRVKGAERAASRCRPRAGHVSRHRHVARRADDRLPLRGVPLGRPARPAAAAVDPHRRRRRPGRCSSTPRPTCASRRSRNDITRVDAVLFTHSHADHVMGLDEVRRFNVLTGGRSCRSTPTPTTGAELRRIFAYAFAAPPGRAAACRSWRCTRSTGRSTVAGVAVRAGADAARRRSRSSASASAASPISPTAIAIPEPSFALLDGLDVLVLDALRHRPHPTHFTRRRGRRPSPRASAPAQTYFTHICHDLPHAATCAGAAGRHGAGVRRPVVARRRAVDRAVRRRSGLTWTSSTFPTTRGRRAG